MFKFAAPLLAAACVVGFASPAHAVPYSLQEGYVMDSAGNYDAHPSPLFGYLGDNSTLNAGTVNAFSIFYGYAPDWDEAWTFILDNGTNYTGVGSNGNVAQIVHLAADGAAVWSRGFTANPPSCDICDDYGSTFASVLSYALTLSTTTQVVGDPGLGPSGGAREYNAGGGRHIGLVNQGLDGIAHLVDIAGTLPGGGGFSGDAIDVQGTSSAQTVPEPATLTLLGIGGAVAAIRRRRKA